MIEKIINVLIYLGTTLLSGYMIYQCNQMGPSFGIFIGLLGIAVSLFIVQKTNFKDQSLSQLLEVIGLTYGIYFIYSIFKIVNNSINLDFQINLLCYSSFMYIYTLFFYLKMETFLTKWLYKISSLSLIFSFFLELANITNMETVISFISLSLIIVAHFSEMNKENISNKYLSKYYGFIQKNFSYKNNNTINSPQNMIYVIAIFSLIVYSFPSSIVGLIIYYSLLALILGLLTVLNNKKTPIIAGFWISLGKIFYIFFSIIEITLPVWILIGGILCILIALLLKKIKKHLESKKNIHEYAPKFLLKLKIDDKK